MFSEVIGYGTDFELTKFQYDLWLWSAFGGAKNASGVSLRASLSDKTFSPEYWRTMHAALVDMQRQLGMPSLFITVAPYEWSAPYHAFIEDELKKAFRSRTWLPAAESCHLAHVLKQFVVGLLTGANRNTKKRKDRTWQKHTFAAKDGSGRRTVVNYFARLESQDGKRKRKTGRVRDYHGRGTVHVHCLVWLTDEPLIALPDVVAAHLPEDNEPLKQVLLALQCSYTGSGWPQRDEPSEWNAGDKLLKLHHDRLDKKKGIRGFMEDCSGSLFCHNDVQASDGRGMLLRYTSGYVPKFSDSFATTWLNDEASDYAIARRVLADYHPLEPEMWLQLAAQFYQQCFAGGSKLKIMIPIPWLQDPPLIVQAYCNNKRRNDSMSFLEFLRKTNKDGDILRHIKVAFAAEDDALDLDKFAQEFQPQGEVLVAAIVLSRMKDNYFGQWMMLHVPFRAVDDLWLADAAKVPPEYKYFALCMMHRPAHWRNPLAVRSELELEASRTSILITYCQCKLPT